MRATHDHKRTNEVKRREKSNINNNNNTYVWRCSVQEQHIIEQYFNLWLLIVCEGVYGME